MAIKSEIRYENLMFFVEGWVLGECGYVRLNAKNGLFVFFVLFVLFFLDVVLVLFVLFLHTQCVTFQIPENYEVARPAGRPAGRPAVQR